MRQIGLRWAFVVAVTAVVVFFSEKMYWYPQGYAFGELILFYAAPVYVCLWAAAYFRVRQAAGVVLVGALFGVLVEGVLTPVIYEGGVLDPVLPAYFLGWHGLLAFGFGWWWLHHWLRSGRWQRLLPTLALVGLLWGTWSLTYWLPEQAADFALAGQWSTVDFGLHAFTFTLLLMAAHVGADWLLGRGVWPTQFKPAAGEKWLVVAALVFFFVTLALPAAPLGVVKLGVMLAAVLVPLHFYRRRTPPGLVLEPGAGPLRGRYLATLLLMPSAATAVYGVATAVQPMPETLRAILELKPLLVALAGALAYLWAMVWVAKRPFSRDARQTLPASGRK